MTQVFTFWEGPLPEYVKLCMGTWKFPFTVLNYSTLPQYTDLNLKNKDKFSLPHIADCVRVHVLRDNGGCWLDADTILLNDQLPEYNILGNPTTRSNSIGFLRIEPNSEMFIEWAKFQDNILSQDNPTITWDIVGNAFTDTYVKEHSEIVIGDITRYRAEDILQGFNNQKDKYRKFYFEDKFTLKDVKKTNMLMLHNSWTPKWYKQLSRPEVLSKNCTLSNILRELI